MLSILLFLASNLNWLTVPKITITNTISNGDAVQLSNLYFFIITGTLTMSMEATGVDFHIDGEMYLFSSGVIIGESSQDRIYGANGYIFLDNQSLSTNTAYNNIGGMGISITTGATAPGSTNIKRYHNSRSGTGLTSSVDRWFDISPSTNAGLDATLKIEYFTEELNGLTDNAMTLYKSTDIGSTWTNEGGIWTDNGTEDYITLTGIDGFSDWTASSYCTLVGSVTNTICAKESIVVNGNTYDAATPNGTETFTGIGPNICDSIVTINLTVLPNKTGTNNQTVCYSGSISVNGNTYDAATPTGTETFTGIGPNSCDSIVTVNLTVLPEKTGTNNQTVCFGGSISVNGNTYDAATPTGTETFTGIGANSCDSIVTVNLTVLATIDISTTTNNMVMTANTTNATYQWLDCNNNNNPISGETNQTYTASTSGNYSVVVTIVSCSDTSACINLSTVGINETNFGEAVSLYPNPATGNVNLNFGQSLNGGSVIIADVKGKQVYSLDNLNRQLLNLDINHFSNGIYFVKILNNNQQKVIKLIKQ